MKIIKCTAVIGCMMALCLAGTLSVADAGPAAIEDQIKVMREQMEMMQKRMQELEQELQAAQKQSQQTSEEVQKQMSEVAGRFKVLDDLTQKFGHIKLNGYVRSRWWQGDHQQNSFDVTEIALQLRYDVSENISGEFHLWFHPSGNNFTSPEYNNWAGPTTFIESAFAEFRNLNIGPIQGKLIAGKTRNLAFGIVPAGNYAGRVTSDYSLFHESVNISRITGLQYLTSYKNFRWNFAVFNGWGYSGANLYGARNSGILKLGVGQENTDEDSNKAFSTRMAYVFPRSDFFDKLEIGLSYLRQELSTRDMTNIYNLMGRGPAVRGILSRPLNTYDDTDTKYGFDLALDKGPFMFKAEYLRGDTADVKAHYWYVMPGFLLSKVNPKIPLDFFLRYSVADYNEETFANITASGAWDKSQVTPLIVYHLHPRAKLYFEYYFNHYDKPNGINTRDNDYCFVELILFY